MTILTAEGSFAKVYLGQFNDAKITSIRILGKDKFVDKLRQAKVVIHNAATLESTSLEHSLERNFDFTRFLVEQLEEINPDVHLIMLSSMSILDSDNDLLYGDVLQMTPYAYSKYLAETYCLKSRLSHVSCVRFATLFYKDPKKDGLSKLVADAVTNGRITIFNHGDARRNFLPLHVASQYINKLTQLKDAPKRTYTFAAQDPTSFKEVALFLKRCLPRLKIEDKTIAQGPQVLASFSTEDIKAIGPIKFSLEDEITDYIETLKK